MSSHGEIQLEQPEFSIDRAKGACSQNRSVTHNSNSQSDQKLKFISNFANRHKRSKSSVKTRLTSNKIISSPRKQAPRADTVFHRSNKIIHST